MSIFWRLTLAYYIAAVIFYNRPFFRWRNRRPVLAGAVQGLVFLGLGGLLCRGALTASWPLADLWQVPGWVCLLLLSAFYVFNNALFVERSGQLKYYILTFVAHDMLALLAIFLCSPFYVVYLTGNLLAEPWAVFCVGLIVITKMFSIFIYMTEQDLYGRDYPTIDEGFVTMLMRLIFYLLALLPGWRWVVWFVVWLWACQMANRNRLMDISRFALYFSALGATAVGLIAKWSFYLY